MDVMSEEDAAETLVAMMCITDDTNTDLNHYPSDSSIWGKFGLGDGVVDGCHFDLCGEQDRDGRCVIIRNLPAGYAVNMSERDELLDMVQSGGIQLTNVTQARRGKKTNIYRYFSLVLPLLKIVMETENDARAVEMKMDGTEFEGRDLIAKRID